jgi:hypothetical protein
MEEEGTSPRTPTAQHNTIADGARTPEHKEYLTLREE